MSLSPRYFGLCLLLGVAITLGDGRSAFAGWMGFRNDSKETIFIQEMVQIGGQARPGRPQRLFAGEAVRDTPLAGGQRRISIFDPTNLNQPIYSGIFPCPAATENILYCIKRDAKGIVSIEPIKGAADTGPKK